MKIFKRKGLFFDILSQVEKSIKFVVQGPALYSHSILFTILWILPLVLWQFVLDQKAMDIELVHEAFLHIYSQEQILHQLVDISRFVVHPKLVLFDKHLYSVLCASLNYHYYLLSHIIMIFPITYRSAQTHWVFAM